VGAVDARGFLAVDSAGNNPGDRQVSAMTWREYMSGWILKIVVIDIIGWAWYLTMGR
jgi:hypothetical protein